MMSSLFRNFLLQQVLEETSRGSKRLIVSSFAKQLVHEDESDFERLSVGCWKLAYSRHPLSSTSTLSLSPASGIAIPHSPL